MKKLFVFILAFIYLAEASGMSLYKHYCMDRLVSWGLVKGGSNCPSCGMKKVEAGKGRCKGCCKDEHKVIKLSGDHKAETFLWQASLLTGALPVYHSVTISEPLTGKEYTWNSIHAPPLRHKVPAYLFHCVFRI